MLSLVSKLEIDVMQANELNQAIELSYIYRMPSIVVHQDLTTEAVIQRARHQAHCCKIITPINWPKGDRFGVTKMHTTPVNALSQDGFEIMLCPRNVGESRREMIELVQFIRSYLPLVSEIRFVIGALVYEQPEIVALCEALRGVPTPNFIRTDTNLRIQQARANPVSHNEILQAIRSAITLPVKLSGNIGTIKMMALCKADRYAVSLKQAQAIIKEIIENPKRVEKLLDTTVCVSGQVSREQDMAADVEQEIDV